MEGWTFPFLDVRVSRGRGNSTLITEVYRNPTHITSTTNLTPPQKQRMASSALFSMSLGRSVGSLNQGVAHLTLVFIPSHHLICQTLSIAPILDRPVPKATDSFPSVKESRDQENLWEFKSISSRTEPLAPS